MKWRLEDVFDQAVDEYHKYRTQRELYRRNFVPVWRHLLEPDMMTLPPDVGARRMPGRPKTVRLRKNSRYAHEPEKSPTICSRCHQPGHNQNSGSDCCNLEAINTPPTSTPIQNRDRNMCLDIQTSCSKVHGLRCCDGLECRDRSINVDSICSAVTKNSKTRLSDGGDSLGGSDRRSRKGVRGGEV
ncbi:hypothetical protein IV203_021038 [Nitzschia inconspicua]|uniref:Uncharacterized protein n=1 Tax=Nitzschia inconspicua TaxID=303405 RepID=A0A9K3PD34_9STRA|nr:hypothetical protein IV203_021038 [Nitzschia inconspicua]